mmetsp:Transcript_28718/g.60972  ORF Transcript_28718/g.60972 Transcript_28718/m.60972 type:complete len:187 (+) Transcript_28718:197-757(+)
MPIPLFALVAAPGRCSCGLRTLVLAVATALLPSPVVGVSSSCSNLDPYARWAETWASSCRPTTATASFNWFASCSWVTCPCLWGALDAPVPTDELAVCFKQALDADKLSQDVKWFVTAMMRTCKGHTDQLSAPCGLCDKYKQQRTTCPASGGTATSSRRLSELSEAAAADATMVADEDKSVTAEMQ